MTRAARPMLVVLRALGLGDYLTGVPALRALGDAFPEHRLLLAAPGPLAPLVALTGAGYSLVATGGLERLPHSLRQPAVAVDLHGRGPGSQPLLLELQPARLVSFAHRRIAATAGSPRWRREEHETRRWCRLLTESGIPADPSRIDLPAPPITPPPWVRGATVVHPGAGSPSRRWPPERFAAVVRAERAAGREVLVTAGPGEEELAVLVARLADLDEARVVTPGDLGVLAAVVAAAGRLVAGDTGVAHLATALRTPSVVLFGPIPPRWWGPPTDRPWHVALWAGRMGDPHGGTVDPGLLEIGTADVLAALRCLPAPPPAGNAVVTAPVPARRGADAR